MADSNTQNLFSCLICLDLLKHPIGLPCGHSYCMTCISRFWDEEEQKGVFSCPQCRETFSPRPVLQENHIIAMLVEKRRMAAPRALCYAGPGDVECDVCTGRKVKAVKSCLVCLVSYCETHFKLHNEVNPGGKHAVTDATGRLQEKICSQHHKLLEVFCRTDRKFICLMCLVDDHKHHDTVTAADERAEQETELANIQRKSRKRIQETEMKVQFLKKAGQKLKRSAQAAVMDSEKIFTQMIHSIKRRHSEVSELIRDQEKAELSRVEEFQGQLEQEITDLRRRDAELEQLSNTEDHIHFLQSFPSLCAPLGLSDLCNINVNQRFSFSHVNASFSDLKDKLEDFCMQEGQRITTIVKDMRLHQPVTREELFKYYCRFTMDPKTAHGNIRLSEDNRTLTCTFETNTYRDLPSRFDNTFQVLCKQAVTRRSYWEVQCSRYRVSIAVSYKDISRKGKGNECRFGFNDKSWKLSLHTSSSSFRHNNSETKLPPVSSSSRIGVYVDHSAGTLSFYSVSDTMTLLYRVQTTFTQPLYPGFGINNGSTVELCDI
ncbi:tripartite motif-containing protein 16-like [Denticeps clupeoides]|uniref:tripartite motif-containing protein 16-like n=1 Tax=Denticeps clupeoides TaxID=299321 RepID=UPI0010A43DCA|nr:tripartite motif-containing protein 16-like [Denticeps clupeoides]